MKASTKLFGLLILSVLQLQAEPEENPKDKAEPSILTFSDKMRLSGFPAKIDAKKELLTINSSSLDGLAKIKTQGLLEMTLTGEPKDFKSDHYAIATIEKHFRDPHMDTIRGRLVNLDDESITLETWYAGPMKLRRSMVRSLDIFKVSPSFYDGPNGPKGWVSASGKIDKNWVFKDRSMTSKARSGIARKVDIPNRAKITFTAQWKSTPYFRILFFSDDGSDDYPGIGYTLNVQRTYMNIYRNTPKARNTDIFSESIRNLVNAEKAEFTIYLDRDKNGTNALYIDDVEVGTWTGVDDTIFEGNWIHFVPQNSTPIKFSKISIAQWDGSLPASSNSKDGDEGIEGAEGQKIRLANGDVVIGTVKSIDDGIVALRTSFGDVPVPINRMRNVALSDKVDEVRMEKGDVRAWFHEGGYITIKLEDLDDKKLRGYSQVWGNAEFDINAFSRIEFNIWRPELDSARYGSSTDW